jgi:hypothetical protein
MVREGIWTFAFLLFALFSTSLHAQARFAVYGTVGGERSGLPNEGVVTAGTFGLYVGVAKAGPFYLSADARADLSSDINSGLVGPRLALKLPVFPLKPYAEMLIGASSYSRTAAGLKDPSKFAARYVFGVDTAIFPHLDWRIADFSYDLESSAGGSHAETLSTGLVVRF